MIRQTYFLNFTETAITRQWMLDGKKWTSTSGFKSALLMLK